MSDSSMKDECEVCKSRYALLQKTQTAHGSDSQETADVSNGRTFSGRLSRLQICSVMLTMSLTSPVCVRRRQQGQKVLAQLSGVNKPHYIMNWGGATDTAKVKRFLTDPGEDSQDLGPPPSVDEAANTLMTRLGFLLGDKMGEGSERVAYGYEEPEESQRERLDSRECGSHPSGLQLGYRI
ncbi:protein TANC2 isoform X3 [Tachysurus ichikawai]